MATELINNVSKSKTYQYAAFSIVFFSAMIAQEGRIINLVGESWNDVIQIFAIGFINPSDFSTLQKGFEVLL